MKEELLKSVCKGIEVLESKVFDKEIENNQLNSNMKALDSEFELLKNENAQIKKID
jgi:hypothetical protein